MPINSRPDRGSIEGVNGRGTQVLSERTVGQRQCGARAGTIASKTKGSSDSARACSEENKNAQAATALANFDRHRPRGDCRFDHRHRNGVVRRQLLRRLRLSRHAVPQRPAHDHRAADHVLDHRRHRQARQRLGPRPPRRQDRALLCHHQHAGDSRRPRLRQYARPRHHQRPARRRRAQPHRRQRGPRQHHGAGGGARRRRHC